VKSLSEWLLVPLFLLPFAVGGGLCWFAADAHERELAPYRYAGELQAKIWLRDTSTTAWMRNSFYDDVLEASGEDGWIDFTHPGGDGRVRVDAGAAGSGAWTLALRYPAGLLPEALSDAGIRLKIETGAAPAEIEGADAATLAFRDLYVERDLDRLRTAPLPASTKLFLLGRWREQDSGDPVLATAARLLEILKRATLDWPLGPGAHRVGEISILASDGRSPALVYPDAANLPPRRTYLASKHASHPVQLVWAFPPLEGADSRGIWAGRLSEPLAGDYRFLAREGVDWWRSGRVRRWAGPVGIALLAFLALPSVLLVSMRRRRRLDEARARFINELAHDLRTPLTSLRLYADMLAGGKAKEDDRGRYVDVIARESARLTSLLGNLLDLSRLEGGRRNFEPETLLLDEVAEHAVADFAALYPKRADDIRVTGQDDLKVRADRTALSRCLGNLLDNAGKFTAEGTPVALAWRAKNGRVRIFVSDDGPGIPASDQSRIFDRYARGRQAQKDGVPGTGLGLSLVKELVTGMGGTIRLVPADKGASFEILLPGAADE
jgi:signal transduction histidine kinase